MRRVLIKKFEQNAKKKVKNELKNSQEFVQETLF